ncbi:MAG TPA: aspartate--tRNA ligase [Kiritimatiellia bacterium]|nr:aspartate--tRNA ligase [Kiritimatiellia bacterium]HSA17300.1 aspartate--tRNA ligase [Kiritimatiellia bacterium]
MMRSHTCGELRKSHVGQRVQLCGWVDTVRDHGGVIFIDLRDRYGVTQVIFDPRDSQEAWDRAQGSRGEYVIRIEGTVEPRPADMANPKLATGEIEVRSNTITVLNRSATPPFPLDDEEAAKVSEDLRMAYRYLDLRRPQMQKNMRYRHEMVQAIRVYLDRAGFTDIETPMMTKSTPEGARDYLVPSRILPGTFYALPQSPQQYKQLLMLAGFDRYYQVARCFRDEDLRADRQPEFTQIDMELSFVTPEDIYGIIDGLLAIIMKAAGHGEIALPLPRMKYDDAMNRFGSDKPDVRFGMEMTDVSDVFAGTQLKVFAGVLAKGGVVKALNAKGQGNTSLSVMDDWTAMAKDAGLGGLAYIRVSPEGEWKSPIAKFLSEGERQGLTKKLGMQPGDLVMFGADKLATVNTALGRIRLIAGEAAGLIDPKKFAFTWVTDFPLFERNDEGELQAMHHPFTSPHAEDLAFLDSDPLRVRAQAYDIVLNGVELGGGSIRIHDPELQARMFKILGIPTAEIEDRFGHLIRAFGYGAPPHGGIALGLDRLIMLMVGGESIRDVIAFPKTQKAMDLMMNAPARVDAKQLRDVHIRLDLPVENPATGPASG